MYACTCMHFEIMVSLDPQFLKLDFSFKELPLVKGARISVKAFWSLYLDRKVADYPAYFIRQQATPARHHN